MVSGRHLRMWLRSWTISLGKCTYITHTHRILHVISGRSPRPPLPEVLWASTDLVSNGVRVPRSAAVYLHSGGSVWIQNHPSTSCWEQRMEWLVWRSLRDHFLWQFPHGIPERAWALPWEGSGSESRPWGLLDVSLSLGFLLCEMGLTSCTGGPEVRGRMYTAGWSMARASASQGAWFCVACRTFWWVFLKPDAL